MGDKPELFDVLHVSNSMDIGGAERALFQLIRAQDQEGTVKPSLLVLAKPGLYADYVSKIGLKVHRPALKCKTKLMHLLEVYKSFRAAKVVHFHSPQPLFMALSMVCPKTKFVYTHRAGDHSYKLKRRIAYSISAFFVRNYFCGVSANTAFAGNVVRRLFRLQNKNVFTTYNGVDFSLLESKQDKDELREKYGISPESFCVGTTANLRKLKRVDYLIKAISNLPEGVVGCIVGDGPELKSLQNLALELGVSDRCVFVGKVDSVSDVLKTMDCFLFTSDKSESFGNSVVEAIGVGLPSVVMQDSPGVVEHMGYKNAMVADSVGTVEKMIRRVMTDTVYRNSNSLSGQQHVLSKYTYANCVSQYNELYKAL